MSKSREDHEEEGLTHNLETAAHEAAMADGLIPHEGSEGRVKKSGLRRGKWTAEEESYANRLIYEFKLGLLPLTDGTTLRTFLSKLLNCDPMRISKKFVGQNCIGKQVFRRRQQDLEKLTAEQIDTSRRELAELERKFLERVAQTNRTKTSGVKVIKDGRAEDENGNHSVAPWMIQPEESQPSSGNEHLQRSSTHTPAPVSSSSYQNKEQPAFNPTNQYPPNQQNSRMVGYGVGTDLMSVDYQHLISANSALMNHLYQGPQYPFMPPNYAMPPPPGFIRSDYPMNGGSVNNQGVKPEHIAMHYPPPFDQYPHYPMDHHMNRIPLPNPLIDAAAFPWNQMNGMNPLDHMAVSNANMKQNLSGNNNSTSTSHEQQQGSLSSFPFPASSSDWQIQSLLGAGESMENIVQFLTQFQGSQSFENVQIALAGHQQKKEEAKDDTKDSSAKTTEDMSLIKKSSEDIGYPFEDGHPTNNSNGHNHQHTTTAKESSPNNDRVKENEDIRKSPAPTGNRSAKSELNSSGTGSTTKQSNMNDYSSEMNGYVIPNDTMASMAPMYQRSSHSDSTGRIPPGYINPALLNKMMSRDPTQPSGSSTNANNLPRNSSIENFWMLVNMGDLPRPDQDVLSETIWESQQGAPVPRPGVGVTNLNHLSSLNSTTGQPNQHVVAVPVVPSSSLVLGKVKEEALSPSFSENRKEDPTSGTANTQWKLPENRKRGEEAVIESTVTSSPDNKSSDDTTRLPKKMKIEKDS